LKKFQVFKICSCFKRKKPRQKKYIIKEESQDPRLVCEAADLSYHIPLKIGNILHNNSDRREIYVFEPAVPKESGRGRKLISGQHRKEVRNKRPSRSFFPKFS